MRKHDPFSLETAEGFPVCEILPATIPHGLRSNPYAPALETKIKENLSKKEKNGRMTS